MTSFKELGLAAPILSALSDEGYANPTPIQAQAIPHVMAGRDLMGIAQTGTGKTAAFTLPILHNLAAEKGRTPPRQCRVLILSPTRELAGQIADSVRAYSRHMRISVATVFGGVSHGPQAQMLQRGVDVLVATPGRLLDHMATGSLRLDGVKVFVLDEADQMLDMGFIHSIRKLVKALPKQRQTLFFSATMPKEIAALAADMLDNPERVAVAPVSSTAERVTQKVVFVDAPQKRVELAHLGRGARQRDAGGVAEDVADQAAAVEAALRRVAAEAVRRADQRDRAEQHRVGRVGARRAGDERRLGTARRGAAGGQQDDQQGEQRAAQRRHAADVRRAAAACQWAPGGQALSAVPPQSVSFGRA